MAGPVLVPSLIQLRAEIDALAPGRAKGADGWIGDTAHQQRVSDHNDDEVGAVPIHDTDKIHEVHALDITTDLRAGSLEIDDIVSHVLARCRSGEESRLRYIIWDHEIFEAAVGWRPATYAGDDPHTGHAHFSASYDSLREADTRPWLETLRMLTPQDRKDIADIIDTRLKAWGKVDPIASIYARTGALANGYGLSGVADHLTEMSDQRAADMRTIDNGLTKILGELAKGQPAS